MPKAPPRLKSMLNFAFFWGGEVNVLVYFLSVVNYKVKFTINVNVCFHYITWWTGRGGSRGGWKLFHPLPGANLETTGNDVEINFIL